MKRVTITVVVEVDDDWAAYDRREAQFDMEQIIKTAVGEFGTLRSISSALSGWPRTEPS